jgi:PKD repeat protein
VKHFRVYWLTCVLTILAVFQAQATTIVMPTDEQLVAKTPLIVVGTVVGSEAVERGGQIWTETILNVEQSLKGSSGKSITVREVGGVIGDRITKIFGAPEYQAGERVMAFLTPTPRGDYQTMDLFVGKFSEARTASGQRLWTRHDEAQDVLLLDSAFKPIPSRNVERDADGFERFITRSVAGQKAPANYGVGNPVLARPQQATHSRFTDNFTLISEPTIYRWFAFDNGGSALWYSYGTQPGYSGGGVNEIKTAMNVWTGYASAKINYQYAGAEQTHGSLSATNGVNEVLFNDPNQEIAGSWNPATGGVVGQGGFNGVTNGGNWTATFTADGSHQAGTFHAYNIVEGNLVIQDNVSPGAGIPSSSLAEIVAHEFGHTLGFGHSSDHTALMYATIQNLGPSLRADDQLAARWLYPNGSAPPPPPPTVPAAPTNLTAIPNGTNVALQWTDNATNETGERVYVAQGGGSYSKVADLAAGQRAVTLTGFSAGTWQIYVTSYNAAGESNGSNVVQVVIGTPITAAFSASQTSGFAGQTSFTFTDQSSGPVSSRSWDFGDGMTATGTAVSHIYNVAGGYTVTLTVSGGGTQTQATKAVVVTAPLVSLNAFFAYTPSNPTTATNVSFADQSSGTPVQWQWNFGDNSALSSVQNPTHRYSAAGSYIVTLTVFRGAGFSSTSQAVNVGSVTPVGPPPVIGGSSRSLISVTAQTNGASGSVWRTELSLFNAGSDGANVRLDFVPGAGGTPQSRDVYLQPRQSMTYANALLDIFGMANGAGAIAIEASSPTSTPSLKVSSRTFTTGDLGTYGQAVPDVDASVMAQTLYLTGIESDNDYRTNVGIVNNSGIAVATTLALTDVDGNPLGTTTVTMPANSFQQSTLAALFPNVSGRLYASLSMRATAATQNAISVYASVVDNRTQNPVYIQGAPEPVSTSLVLPVVGRAPGINGTFWRSDVTLFNPTQGWLTGNVRCLAAGSDNRFAGSRPISIAPGRTVILADVLSWLGLSSGSGALELMWNSAAAVVTSRTYTTAANGGTYGQSIDPIASFGQDVYVTGLRSDSAYRSNVGFVNGADTPITISVSLLSPLGQTLAATSVQLQPRSQAQYSVASLFPNAATSSLGTFTLQAHSDATSLFAYGSVIDNLSGDPVFFAGQ